MKGEELQISFPMQGGVAREACQLSAHREPMRQRSPWWPYFLLTLPPLFWALNVIVARAMRNDIPPVAMCFWRWIIAGVIVVPFAAAGLRSK